MPHLRALVWFSIFMAMAAQLHSAEARKFLLAVHGGAGVWRNELTPERERACRDTIHTALAAGSAILRTNGASLDAVEAAIRILEDSPLFNAGKGSVLTREGTVEMDASIMDGATRKAGAVAAVKRVKNPISAARLVMEQSPHVLLVGAGADAFVKSRGATLMSPRYFITAERKRQLEKLKSQPQLRSDAAAANMIGTVGAVALDGQGNLAAGTSTGGMANKAFGRVGDSPIIGAGTYANNATCALSATGHGEFFIRSVVGHDVSALMEYKRLPLREAGAAVLRKVQELGGTGGFIAIDAHGNITMPFNTEGMFRGVARSDGKMTIAVFPD